jgi:RNA polymerase sigma-70 factor (ECF subfamily)
MKEGLTYNCSMDKRTNDEWIADLRAGGDRQARALEDMHAIILEGLPNALSGRLSAGAPEFESFVKSIAKKTIAQGLEHINDFEGHSAFTTWALKIAVRQALYELRQQHRPIVSARWGLPEIPSELHDKLKRDKFMQYIHRVFKEELTDNQRTAIRAMIMSRVPKEEVAMSLGMKRCDYFKMIHDARLRLKRRLEVDGWFSVAKVEER